MGPDKTKASGVLVVLLLVRRVQVSGWAAVRVVRSNIKSQKYIQGLEFNVDTGMVAGVNLAPQG